MAGIQLSCQYAFTITLKPRLYSLEPSKQYDKVIDLLCQALHQMGKVTSIAELTKASNIHFHGIIQFYLKGLDKSVRYEWNRVWRQYKDLIGFTNLKQIDDYHKWKDYLQKDLEQTRKDLVRPPIVLDELDTFKELYEFTKIGLFRINHYYTHGSDM